MADIRTCPGKVTLVRYTPRSLRGEVLAPRGSIVVYLAAAKSDRIDAIYGAARRGSIEGGVLGDVDTIPTEAVAKVSLRYGDQLLAADVPVPADGRAVRLILPYNGGQVIAEDLTIVEESSESRVAAVAVVHNAALSRVEEAALALLPPDQLHLNLGVALPGGVVGLNDEERRRQEEERRAQQEAADEARRHQQAEQAQAAAEAHAERAEARREEHATGGMIDIHLLDPTVIALGPALSAGVLLGLRRNMLIGG